MDTIRQFLAVQFVEVGRALFIIATVIPLMWSLNQRMTLVTMAIIPAIFGFAYLFFLNVQKVFQASDEAEGRMSTVLQENLSGIRVVRAFTRRVYEIENLTEQPGVSRHNLPPDPFAGRVLAGLFISGYGPVRDRVDLRRVLGGKRPDQFGNPGGVRGLYRPDHPAGSANGARVDRHGQSSWSH